MGVLVLSVRERLEGVSSRGGLAVDLVDVENECVQLGTDDGTAVLVPAEGASWVTEVAGKGGHVICGIGECEDAWINEWGVGGELEGRGNRGLLRGSLGDTR